MGQLSIHTINKIKLHWIWHVFSTSAVISIVAGVLFNVYSGHTTYMGEISLKILEVEPLTSGHTCITKVTLLLGLSL